MSDLRIKTCVLGAVSTNCYILYNCASKEAVIVDPGDNAPYIMNKCRELDVKPVAVALTHGHFDHILAVPELSRSFHVPVYASAVEDAMLADTSLNLSGTCDSEPTSFHADELLRDGQEFTLLGLNWKLIATPGHTAGSACYYIADEGVLLAGDTLFADSYGRTDLPTGSSAQLVESILDKLFILPEDTMVYPGHGDPTTIGHEKQFNPVTFYRRHTL
ncbi:MBL fold metallo-hydrolase [Enterocloster lavalensis]|uniref:MBL fold metallo-hydrolase n=1 Tax=Enterocloster lavalensis TaxID=460384 RepID=UPI0023F4BF70|nr:MBL fold metallo-hydrolase [Enterocloster lavalensis]